MHHVKYITAPDIVTLEARVNYFLAETEDSYIEGVVQVLGHELLVQQIDVYVERPEPTINDQQSLQLELFDK